MALLVAAFAWVLLQTAWLCDDAYITFRASQNLTAGHGLVWNPTERVQAFTNPLWMFAVAGAYALVGDMYTVGIALSLVCSLGAFLLLIGPLARGPWAAAAAAAWLLGSKAFVDYSSSGLENPLSHLLLVLLALAGLAALALGVERRAALAWALLFGSLLLVNRLDHAVLLGPLGLLIGVRGIRRLGVARTLVCTAPLWLWLGFATLYFGTPLPNTAYAKALELGVERSVMLRQGWTYLADAWRHDPATIGALALGLAAAGARRDRWSVALGLGVLLHLGYVIWVGGDFMRGRFLAAPVVVAAILLVRAPWFDGPRRAPRVAWALVAAALLVGTAFTPRPNLTSGVDYARVPSERGISDERGFYYHLTGWRRDRAELHALLDLLADRREGLRTPGIDLVLAPNIGMAGFMLGPEVHLVDTLGLADPLLARLPGPPTGEWHVGHVERRLPEGYLESLALDQNRIADPGLAEFYGDLRLATRGSLWAQGRLSALLRLWRGVHRPAVEAYRAQYGELLTRPVAALVETQALGTVAAGDPWFTPGSVALPGRALHVPLGETRHWEAFEIGLHAGRAYVIVVSDGQQGLTAVVTPVVAGTGLQPHAVHLGPDVARQGFSLLAIDTVGDELAIGAVGWIRLPPERN